MKKVLLVNDSRFESMVLEQLFSSFGYDVAIADEYEAMEEVDAFDPELVVVNYIMENTSGEKLIQRIKDQQPEIRCLISSNSPLSLSVFEPYGVDGILRTPVSAFTLKDVLRRVSQIDTIDVPPVQGPIRVCDHCNAELSAFSLHIQYCPFCGEEVVE